MRTPPTQLHRHCPLPRCPGSPSPAATLASGPETPGWCIGLGVQSHGSQGVRGRLGHAVSGIFALSCGSQARRDTKGGHCPRLGKAGERWLEGQVHGAHVYLRGTREQTERAWHVGDARHQERSKSQSKYCSSKGLWCKATFPFPLHPFLSTLYHPTTHKFIIQRQWFFTFPI